jgi:hypothetical protein
MRLQSGTVLAGAASFLFAVGGLCAVAGFFIVLGQCLIWLKTGNWLPVSVGMVVYAMGSSIPDIELNWVGVERMIDGVISFVVDLPASVTLIAIAAVVSIVAEILQVKARAAARASKQSVDAR